MTPWRFLIVSIAFHGVLLLGLVRWAQVNGPVTPPEMVSVDYVEPKANKKRLAFVSDEDHFTETPTSVPLSAKTNNSPKLEDLKPQFKMKLDPDGLEPAPREKLPESLMPPDPRSPASQESAPLLPESTVSSLNKERSVYYSFFTRVDEKFGPLWRRIAFEKLDAVDREILKDLRNKTLVTLVEVILDPQGNVIKTIVFQSSGLNEFDASSELGFKAAQKFPNPPKGMIRPDGTVRLYYLLAARI